MKLMRLFVVIAISFSAAAYAAHLQRPARLARQDAAKKTEPDKGKAEDRINIKFLEWMHNSTTERGEAKGITIVDDKTLVQADHGKWDNRPKVQLAETVGNIKMIDPQADATGDKALIYYAKSKKLLILTGGVQITIKPRDEEQTQPAAAPGPAPVSVQAGKATVQQPGTEEKPADDDSPRKHPTVVTCDKVEYQYGKDKKHAILSGHFKAVQTLKGNVRTLTADHGEWFGLEDRLVLYPPVHFEDTKGMIGDPKGEVTIHTKKGDEWIKTGPGEVSFPSSEVEEGDKEKGNPNEKTPDKTKKPQKL